MARALLLARAQDRQTSPNPLVGCVIALDGRIIGEGAYRRDGGPHAEIEAISRLTPTDRARLPLATAYVSLEPCSIFGRTPPCADRLVAEGIGRVVVATIDRTPGVCGQGLAILRRGGSLVEVGLGQEVGLELAAARSVFATADRPYIVLKQACSADRYVGRSSTPFGISGRMARLLSHQWRAESDAILVGARTLLVDRPALSTRLVAGASPDVIIYDPSGRLHEEDLASVRSDARGLHGSRCIFWAVGENSPSAHALNLVNNLLIPPPASPLLPVTVLRLSAKQALASLLAQLHERRIGRLLVEGGPQTLARFAAAGYWDEYREFSSRSPLAVANPSTGQPVSAAIIRGDLLARYSVGKDELRVFRPVPGCGR